MIPAKFITLDGVDGSGKSTQLNFIKHWLQTRQIDTVFTREPGGTVLGEEIRALLLNAAGSYQIGLETEALLMFAVRQQHLDEVILPALNSGKWVLSDRFTDATYAYQGAGRGLSYDKIAILEKWVQGSLKPDLTIILDTPLEIALCRVANGADKDRFEKENESFFARVRAAYLQLAAKFPQRYRVISSNQPIELISAEIDLILTDFLSTES